MRIGFFIFAILLWICVLPYALLAFPYMLIARDVDHKESGWNFFIDYFKVCPFINFKDYY